MRHATRSATRQQANSRAVRGGVVRRRGQGDNGLGIRVRLGRRRPSRLPRASARGAVGARVETWRSRYEQFQTGALRFGIRTKLEVRVGWDRDADPALEPVGYGPNDERVVLDLAVHVESDLEKR